MKLLQDIIAGALSNEERLPDLLRKCLVLAYELDNALLKDWVEKELNGYDGEADVPEYRKIRAAAKGLFFGPLNSQIRDQPLASAVLKKEHRHFAESVVLRQPIAAYAGKMSSDSTEKAVIEWPANLVVMYQAKFFEGYALNRAWQEIPTSTIASLVDTVKTKILSFALEIKKQAGTVVDEEDNLNNIPQRQVDRTVINYIYGGQNVIATELGQLHLDARTQVVAGDIESLRKALTQVGVAKDDVAKLESALSDDENSDEKQEGVGPKTQGWLTTAAKKLGSSGLKVTESVAASVVEGIVKAYLKY